MTRFMGVDYGSKRIGLAVGDSETALAAPVLGVAAAGSAETDARRVIQAAEEYGIERFVVGLPLNMDGSSGPQTRLAREFGRVLEHASGKIVEFWDERLSSEQAREKLLPAELSRKQRKARLDGVAAQSILQEFLESQSDSEGRGP